MTSTHSSKAHGLSRGMTPVLYGLIVAAAVLSVTHHLDHVLRGATGWPLTDEVNPFTYSLFVYPVIAVGLVLSLRGRVGPRFWSLISAPAALFVGAVHLGPVAADAVTEIPDGYSSPVAGAIAIGLLFAFIAVLAGTWAYEMRLAAKARPSRAATKGPRALIKRGPLASFVVLAYGWSWSWWVPLALSGAIVEPGVAAPRYVPGLFGPLVAALVVTAATDGTRGLGELLARMVPRRAQLPWFAVAVLAPVGLFLLVSAATLNQPDLADLGRYPALAVTTPLTAWLFAVGINGLGEEAGWRGFALARLRRRYRPLTAVAIVTVIWAAWHAPVVPVLASFRDRGLSGPALLPVFVLGIACLSVVLAWLFERSEGNVLVPALAHGTYNLVVATEAGEGMVGTVLTILTMVGAVILVVRQVRSQRAGSEPHRIA